MRTATPTAHSSSPPAGSNGWRQRTLAEDPAGSGARSEDWVQGWDDALREVVAHLRQGDLIPGGILYTDATGAWEEPR